VGKAKTIDATMSGEKDDAEASHVPVSDIVNNRVQRSSYYAYDLCMMMRAMDHSSHSRSESGNAIHSMAGNLVTDRKTGYPDTKNLTAADSVRTSQPAMLPKANNISSTLSSQNATISFSR
jgi:hypothetical protein